MFIRNLHEPSKNDLTRENDNTLMKYFLPEENTKTESDLMRDLKKKSSNKTPESLIKMYKKGIKLRNALKQCYWDRQSVSDQQTIIHVEDVLPDIQINLILLEEIHNYVLNDFYEFYNGSLKVNLDYSKNKSLMKLISIDVENKSNSNFFIMMNPKLNYNKKDLNEQNLKIFQKISDNIKMFCNSNKINDSIYLSNLINYYCYFTRDISDSENLKCKIFSIFPNLDIQLKRINKITLSKSPLSKFLVNGKSEVEFTQEETQNGFLAMSSKHRLITLINEPHSLKEILFGIWINLNQEKINKQNLNDKIIEDLLIKHKLIIYEKCINFLIKSKKIEVVNSPLPDEGIFLLIIFLSNFQLFYEVKINNNQSNNEFIIMKKKIQIPFHQENQYVNLNLNINIADKILPMHEHIHNKIISKEKIKNSRNNFNKEMIINNFKDPLNEMFEEDDVYLNYNLPFKNIDKIDRNDNNDKLKIGFKNYQNKYANAYNYPTPMKTPNKIKNNLSPEDETLTIDSSHQNSMKSIQNNSRTKIPNIPKIPTKHESRFHTIDHDRIFHHHKKFMSMNEMGYNEIIKEKTTKIPQNMPHQTNTENAYEIIYDQAKSIQTLQDKINSLQKELEYVVTRLKFQEESSLNCSCNKKNNKNLISTGTNTSEDLNNLYNTSNQQSNPQSNNQINDYYNRSNSNSNSITQNLSKRSIKNTSVNIQEDHRYDNFLNENSINFPKQFLEIDCKQFDSNHKEKEEYLNIREHLNSNINMNLIEKNFQFMQNNPNINTTNNNSLLELSKSINFIPEVVEEEEINEMPQPILINSQNRNLKSVKPIHIPQINTDLKSYKPNTLFTPSNFDITSTSIDPPSYRYFLKAPSMIYTGKNNSSILIEENGNFNENDFTKKSYDNIRGNDLTINLPRIIFNESLESNEDYE